MSNVDDFTEACLKHLQGKHNQKRHGWRYGGDQASQARNAMRGQSASERDEYRKRSGMKPVSRSEKPVDIKQALLDYASKKNPWKDLSSQEFLGKAFVEGVAISRVPGKIISARVKREGKKITLFDDTITEDARTGERIVNSVVVMSGSIE